MHDVKLTWDGFIELKENRITQLVLSARGTEKLQFAKDDHPLKREHRNEVAFLPGGRPIDMACGVRYGIIGEPVAGDEVGAREVPAPVPVDVAAQQPGLGRHLPAALGPPFAVFLPVVQDDLKLSDEQKQILQLLLMTAVQGFQQCTQEAEGLPQDQREKKHHEFRREANKKLRDALAGALKPEQQQRLRQIVLQQEGLFALGNPDVAAELKFGTEQERRLLHRIMQETQRRFEALHQKAQTSGKPEEIQQEAAKIRKEQEAKIEALLTDAQKEQCKAMLGKPLALGPDGGQKE